MQVATKLRYDNFVNCFAALGWQNQAKAARQAKFAISSARQTASRLLTYDYVKQAIAKKKAELAKKTGFTIEKAQEMYEDAYELGKETRQPAAMNGSVTGIARLYGMDKDAGSGEKTVIIISPKASKQVESEVIVEDEVQE